MEENKLFKTTKEFYDYAGGVRRLTREEEKELAVRMNEGHDDNARKALTESYIPVVASFIKRHSVGEPSIELIYRGLSVLEEAIGKYNFQNDNDSFTHALSIKLRPMMTAYIADL